MKSRPHPSQECLRSLYEYDDSTVYKISGLSCIGGLRRKSGRTRREHCFIGVKGHKLGYILAYVPGHTGLFLLHRLIWIYHHGDIPDEKLVDHRNHVPYYNWIDNLRLATAAQNQQNRFKKRKGSKGTIIGVIPAGKSFNAFVSEKGKPIFLGRFATEEEASKARTEAATARYGDFFNAN